MLHKTKHYWFRHQQIKPPFAVRIRPSWYEKTAREVWKPERVVETLSRRPEKPITWFDQFTAFLSTPFKRLGVWGWKDTGCEAQARGVLVRDAPKSSDGFWTLDIKLEEFEIGEWKLRPVPSAPRFIRIEVEPGTRAHALCQKMRPRKGDVVETLAPVIVDKDGPFLELHPDEAFRIVRGERTRVLTQPSTTAQPTPLSVEAN